MGNLRGICSISGCGKPHVAKGWCKSHWRRWKAHGDPLGGRASPAAPMEWIEAHVCYDQDDCLPWPFANCRGGYGHVRLPDERKYITASRLMCLLAKGEPPTSLHEAAHSCGNGSGGCVNPRHLVWKTHTENEMDKAGHGTLLRGERHGQARLTEQDVRVIRGLKDQLSLSEIASRYGVHRITIRAIYIGRSWGWLA